mmetsp:Transcript_69188/g.200382  ORF Transcript_69188/g.200382 Transcript_69188/m.200382 type:complete len:682 (-) Transcript_69188:54-2099(-)
MSLASPRRSVHHDVPSAVATGLAEDVCADPAACAVDSDGEGDADAPWSAAISDAGGGAEEILYNSRNSVDAAIRHAKEQLKAIAARQLQEQQRLVEELLVGAGAASCRAAAPSKVVSCGERLRTKSSFNPASPKFSVDDSRWQTSEMDGRCPSSTDESTTWLGNLATQPRPSIFGPAMSMGLESTEGNEDRAFRCMPPDESGHAKFMGRLTYLLGQLGVFEHAERWASKQAFRAVRAVAQLGEMREPKRTGCLARVVLSKCFAVLCVTMIALNAVFLVYTTDYQMSHRMGEAPKEDLYGRIESALMAFYLCELVLKLAVHRMFFFITPDLGWNLLDTVLVLFSLLELVYLAQAATDSSTVNISFMRMLRLFRLAKVLRVVRTVRFFSELRLMFDCVLGSLQSLAWCAVVIAIIVYTFALLLVQGLAQELASPSENLADVDQATVEKLATDFGSVGDGMFTLLKTSTGGEDWGLVYERINSIGGFLPWCFLLYITFFILAAWNIVTGLFVEKALKLAQPDLDTMALEQELQDGVDAEELTRIFSIWDREGSGTITLKQLGELMRHARFRAYLRVRGIDIQDADMFRRMMLSVAGDHREALDIDFVVSACLRMKGLASNMDLHALSFEAKLMNKKQRRALGDCANRLRRIEAILHEALGGRRRGTIEDAASGADCFDSEDWSI